MIEADNRGVVLSFRSGRRPPAQLSRPLTGSLPPIPSPTGGDGDDRLNKEWDLLIRVASHAWSWRDPESLDTLETTVRRLRAWIARDW